MFGARYFGAWYFGQRFFGKRGLVVYGAYTGARYLGRRYFGRRYFGSQRDAFPFTLTTTNTLAMVGTILPSATGAFTFTADFPIAQVGSISLSGSTSIGAALSFDGSDFSFTPPLEGPALVGTIGVTGNFTTTVPAPGVGCYFGNRYFGSRYFGHRYFSPIINFSIAQTNTLALSGVALTSGGFTSEIGIAPTNVLAFSGTIGVAGDLSFEDIRRNNDAGKPTRSTSRKRYIARYKGVDYEFDSIEQVEEFNRHVKEQQADIPKRNRALVKITLAPEFKEEVSELVNVPARMEQMPQSAAMSFVRKIEKELADRKLPTYVPPVIDDPEEDEILSWLL